MTLSNRTRCFVEMAIMMLAVAAPSFAQISAHGYLSDRDQKKALPDDDNDLESTPRTLSAPGRIVEEGSDKRHAQESKASFEL
jgi:hypothetical protein